MKNERLLMLILLAVIALFVLGILATPIPASASLIINYPPQVASTSPARAITTATAVTPSRLITGPFYAVTDLPLTSTQKWERIKELQAEITRLRDLLATLSR